MDSIDEALSFYKRDYQFLGGWILKPGKKITLGNRTERHCRFCGGLPPEVSFNQVAHAIPELLGNKSLVSLYECDRCNKFFGEGIENDLGNWSKPMRTLQRIRGKSGVPTVKSDAAGWRIECDDGSNLKVSHDRIDSVFIVYEKEKRINFRLPRDPYIPLAVLKAFVKIGLSLMPDTEMPEFQRAIAWIKNPCHEEEFEIMAPVFRTFVPGRTSADLLSVSVLRRRHDSKGVPYAFLILAVGNEAFQVMLPSPQHDQFSNEKKSMLLPFPHPGARHVMPSYGVLDLTGTDLVKGDSVSVDMTYEDRGAVGPSEGQP